MKDVIFLVFDLLTTVTKLLGPGASRAIIAENLLLKLGDPVWVLGHVTQRRA